MDSVSIKDLGINGKEIVDVTIILNIWRREYLEEQLLSIFTQTVLPKEIWILQCENHIDAQTIINKFKPVFSSIFLMKADKNLKYFGRFSLAINAVTKYTWLLDDDIIPGKEWLQNCVYKCDSLNAIVSCTGRFIPKNDFQPENLSHGKTADHFVGDLGYYHESINMCPKDTIVDYACNSYFIKTEWLSTYWSIWPITFQSGEDMHLSASCKSKLNINTIVLKQTNIHNSGSLKRKYGQDIKASWRRHDFIKLREKVLKYHIYEHNWTPIRW